MMSTTRPAVMSSVSSASLDRALDEHRLVERHRERRRPAAAPPGSAGSSAWIASATSIMFAFDCRTTPIATAGVPLKRSALPLVLGAELDAADVPSLTSCPPSLLGPTRSPNSSGVFSSPRERTENSRRSDSMRPAGISTLRVRIARSTSCTVSPRAASSAATSHTRIEKRRSPKIWRLTHAGKRLEPALHQPVGDVRQLQQVVVLAREREPEERVGVGVLLGDDRLLDVLGQAAADARHLVADVLGGGLDVAVERELERDGAELLRRSSSSACAAPRRVLSSSSRMSVTADSTTCGFAPGSAVLTETMGGSTSGNSRTGELGVADDAEQHERQAQHAGEHRAADGEVRKLHGSVPAQ